MEQKTRWFRPKIERLESREVPATVIWDGGPTGNGTNWLNPANWQNDMVPGANDVAQIGNTGDNPPIYVDGNTSVNGVTALRPIEFQGGTLNLGQANSQFGTVTFLGGTLALGSATTQFGTVNLNSGVLALGTSISQLGTVNLNGGALDLTDGATIDTAVINGSGTLSILAGRTVKFGNQAAAQTTVNIASNIQGTLIVRRNTTFTGPVTTGAASTIRHDAEFFAGNSQLTLPTNFVENGLLQLVSNTPTTANTTKLNSTGMTIAPGGRMQSLFLSGPGYSLSTGGAFVNQGVISIVQPGGLFWTTLSGNTIQNSGTIELVGTSGVSIGGQGTLTSTGAVVIPVGCSWFHSIGFTHNGQIGGGGSLSLAGPTTLLRDLTNSADLNLSIAGTVNGPGTLINAPGRYLNLNSVTVNAPINNQGFILLKRTNQFNGTVLTTADSLIQIVSYGQATVGKLTTTGFTNTGRIVLDPTSSSNPTVLTVSSGQLINAVGAQIETGNSFQEQFSASIVLNGTSSLLNLGTLLLSGTGLTISGGGTFSNPGAVLDYFHDSLTITSGFVSLNSGTLSGGSYNLGGLMRVPQTITTLNTDLTLNSAAAGVRFGSNNALQTLQSIAPGGKLSLLGDQALTIGANHANAGTIAVGGGSTLTFSGVMTNSGLLTGSGTVAGAVSGSGTIAPGQTLPGRLTIQNGAIVQGVLQARLNGLDAGGEYDQLRVNGPIVLGGTLVLSAGFTPQAGTVFRILDNDGTDPIIETFAGLPEGATINASGLSFRISYIGGTGNDVTLTKLGAPTVAAIVVGDGTAQRSRITQLKVVFDQIIDYVGDPSAAYSLEKIVGGIPSGVVGLSVDTVTTGGHSEATISFSSDTTFGSLHDGRYRLTVIASQITAGGSSLSADSVTAFHRFYGDINGDARIDISDFGFFSTAYLNPASYNAALDYNADGRIDIADFGQFSVRFFTTLP